MEATPVPPFCSVGLVSHSMMIRVVIYLYLLTKVRSSNERKKNSVKSRCFVEFSGILRGNGCLTYSALLGSAFALALGVGVEFWSLGFGVWVWGFWGWGLGFDDG